MLPKRRRLSAREVREVLKRGRGDRAVFISMKSIPSNKLLRAAVVAPKSMAPQAVQRNRLRRALYRALQSFPSSARADVVFFVQKIPPASLSGAFAEDIRALMNKISHRYV